MSVEPGQYEVAEAVAIPVTVHPDGTITYGKPYVYDESPFSFADETAVWNEQTEEWGSHREYELAFLDAMEHLATYLESRT